tara:strand:- start:94 stop:690 length:597 start_codon:yes stop_codon:yes gene_type:complete
MKKKCKYIKMSYEKIQYLLALFALLGLLWKLSIFCFKYIKKEYESKREDRKKLDTIFSELTPNHGSSLKDKVNKLEVAIGRNNELTEKIFSRQRWIMDRQDTPIFESDEKGLCYWVNDKYCKVLKRDSSYFMGNGWKNIIHPEDRERVVDHWENCIRDGIDSENHFRILDSEGKEINVKCAATKTENNGYIGSLYILS